MNGAVILVALLGFAFVIGNTLVRRPGYRRRRTVELGPAVTDEQPQYAFSVSYRGHETEKPSSARIYEIRLDGRKVAEFGTDARGESPEIRKPYGDWIGFDHILEGGGPEPLRLSKRGTKLVEDFLAGRSLRIV